MGHTRSTLAAQLDTARLVVVLFITVTSMTAASCASGPRAAGADIVSRLESTTVGENARVTYVGEVELGGQMRVRRYRLGNGLKVLILVDRSAPVLSYHTWFNVGSRHEREGKTGLAHLFEHLMFNETEHLAAGQFDRTLEAAGGESNAATWVDWTFYYENLPRNELGLVVRLEADRMANLVLRVPQVTSEKEVVANERRYRVDDDVEGAVNERLYATAFTRHPYHWPTIGWMADIEGFTTEDCEAFYRTYYAPNNATVVLVGDVDEEQALRTIQHFYGPLSPSNIPEEVHVEEPPQTRERTLQMELHTPTEKLQLGYRGPAFADYDHAVLSVINEILYGGRSSRLYRRLVSEGELAAEATGSVSPFRDPGLYEMWVSMREGHDALEALRIIEEESARLRTTDVSGPELDKVKNRLELAFLQSLDTVGGKAEQIGFYETVLGDAGRLFSRLEEYRRVSAADIRRVAALYLDPRGRTTIRVFPSGEEEEEGEEETTE